MARSVTFSPVLICLLGIAVAAGAAATFVVSSTVSYSSGSPLNTTMSTTVLGLILILPFAVSMGWITYRRIRGGGLPMSKTVIAGAMLILAIMIVIGILAGVLGSHPEYYFNDNGKTSSSGGTGSNNSPPPPKSGSGNLAPSSFQVVSVPGWVVLVSVAAVGLAMAGLAIPSLGGWSARRRARRNGPPDAAERAAASLALGQALTELDQGSDPRGVIERLYARFLDRVVPLAGDLTVRTPEEIRSETLLPLGVRPAAAAQLTRVFEESRYSSHPMGPEKAATVREAVRLAASDLLRYAPAP